MQAGSRSSRTSFDEEYEEAGQTVSDYIAENCTG